MIQEIFFYRYHKNSSLTFHQSYVIFDNVFMFAIIFSTTSPFVKIFHNEFNKLVLNNVQFFFGAANFPSHKKVHSNFVEGISYAARSLLPKIYKHIRNVQQSTCSHCFPLLIFSTVLYYPVPNCDLTVIHRA